LRFNFDFIFVGNSLRFHNSFGFSTKDRDNDNTDVLNCASEFSSAWWYNSCVDSDLNGPYRDQGPRLSEDQQHKRGIQWHTFKGDNYSMKKCVMKIRPNRT